MIDKLLTALLLALLGSTAAMAQNANSSTTAIPRTTNSNANKSATTPKTVPRAATKSATDTSKAAATQPAPRVTKTKPAITTEAPGSTAVINAFNALLDGIRKADVNAVTRVYWNSPRLVLFNNNGTVTKGWDQMKKNRESSYPDLKDVKLDVRDVSVIMLGKDGALVECLWTQSQSYKGQPETASGRMTLVFKKIGQDWKAVHLHTSRDKEDPSRILPSEQPSATPTPSPAKP